MAQLKVSLSALTRDRLDQAYPLARELDPSLSIERWRAYAESLVAPTRESDQPRGLIVAEVNRRQLRGMLAYRVLSDLEHGRLLLIKCIGVPGGVGRRVVAERLLEGVQELAREHRCTAVHVAAWPHDPWLSDFLRSGGFQQEKTVLCRPVRVYRLEQKKR